MLRVQQVPAQDRQQDEQKNEAERKESHYQQVETFSSRRPIENKELQTLSKQHPAYAAALRMEGDVQLPGQSFDKPSTVAQDSKERKPFEPEKQQIRVSGELREVEERIAQLHAGKDVKPSELAFTRGDIRLAQAMLREAPADTVFDERLGWKELLQKFDSQAAALEAQAALLSPKERLQPATPGPKAALASK